MRFRALASDYDGTLATHDRLTPLAADAVGRARAAGLLVFLVTGRTLFDLTRVCAHLELFDAVVAWHAARGDFSRWVRDVFRDTALAAQLAKIERRSARGDITDTPASFRALVTPLLSAPGTPPASGPHACR
jgi:hypothetical protein